MENGPLRRGNGPLTLWAVFGHPAMMENGPSKKAQRSMKIFSGAHGRKSSLGR